MSGGVGTLLQRRDVHVDADTMADRRTSDDGTCDRCDRPATVISTIGKLCSRHAREETERDAEALRRRKGRAKPTDRGR